ncbi:MAG: molecular chaperone DnaJ [Deltaproteobacteria bacterium]|nr:molecular chaperone DnaJ [Deltaproteobacteria bacterium]
MAADTCGVCGGDGRIHNAFGLTNTCPACHGTGRRGDHDTVFRDVTKTKPSHYLQSNKAKTEEKKKADWPGTFEGGHLATEVRDCSTLSSETKARLIREIIEYEESHGTCTQTFSRKVRKQLRPPGK